MKGYLKYVFFTLIILIMILWLAGFFRPKVKSVEIKPETKVISGISALPVEKQEVTENAYFGEVIPKERSEIATKFMGKVTSIKVKEGDCVREEASLITLDAEDLYAQIQVVNHQIRQAEAGYRSSLAQLELAQKTFERYSRLYQEKAVTSQEFDEVKARYESAKEALEQAKEALLLAKSQQKVISSHLKYTEIKAPFSGCIVEKNIDLGDLAIPGKPLIVMEKGPLQVRLELPEKYFDKVKREDVLEIEVQEFNKRLKGKVVEKSPAINLQTRTFSIRLELEDTPPGLRSGSLVKVLIPEKMIVFLIPEKALFKKHDFTGVFVLKPDKTIELRYVKVGSKREDKIEVLSGLKEGEMVIVEGLERACDGCKVE